MNTDKILYTAKSAALEAGELLRKHYGKLKVSQIRQKSKNDFVTTVDKLSEKHIIRRILKAFPDHSIQAEEGLPTGQAEIVRGGGETRWIIDPLDGTSNYIHQFPMFAVSIGVVHRGVLVAGVVYDPLHREMFSAQKGRGPCLRHL